MKTETIAFLDGLDHRPEIDLVKCLKITQKARNLISRGWCQGSRRVRLDGKFHYCAIGAIDFSVKEHPFEKAYVRRQLENLVYDEYPFSIPVWNDAERRTQQQVLQKFDALVDTFKAKLHQKEESFHG